MEIRNEIVKAIFREVVGPSEDDPQEEILLARIHGSPKSRYGAGMLYPTKARNTEEVDDYENIKNGEPPSPFDLTENQPLDESKRNSSTIESGAADEEPVGLANQYLPSAMGFTVRMKANGQDDRITIKIKSAHYTKSPSQTEVKKVNADGRIETVMTKDGILYSDYWVRNPIVIEPIPLLVNSLLKPGIAYQKVLKKTIKDKDWLKLVIYNRSTNDDKENGHVTITLVLVNCLAATTDDSISNNAILFQNELVLTTSNEDLIVPYREKSVSTDTIEEKELNLLYRRKRVFGIGHGCSVKWEVMKDSTIEKVTTIQTSVIPVYDIPQVAPTSHLELSMLELSDHGDWSKAILSLKKLSSEYEFWIGTLEGALNSPELIPYKEAALGNIHKCKKSLKRIQQGVSILSEADEKSSIVKCFRWMNRAMLWQQQRSKIKQRKWIRIIEGKSVDFELETIVGDQIKSASLQVFHDESSANGRWRPFQLAFILMNIESIINPKSPEREIVDLIWFPTGGGKTEAYLGLTSLTIFHRRLKGQLDFNWTQYGGTVALMRYTLRLLTTQQYERAASLICACDLIRKEKLLELGDEPFSIGLWVGGASTPNDNATARSQFNGLTRSKFEPYNFIVMKCPCCGAQIGKIENVSRDDKVKIKGLKKEDGKNGKILFECENSSCEYYGSTLPLTVVDEYIYETPPTLLLGTVDKFAMLPWKRDFQINGTTVDTSCLFGFRQKADQTWHRITPPELIIQDELHLIAGPLGTMVGLYETMVQTLCNNYNLSEAPFLSNEEAGFIPPKIIASSATISRAFDQVKNLYGINTRDKLHIFPSQGLEFGNTWFSEEKSSEERDDKGKQKFPGRKYVGLLLSGFPSAQTSIVRTYSAVLQKVKELDGEKGIDYYWTLMGYFNSIRELGGASSLVFGDIRERLTQIQGRDLVQYGNRRKLFDQRIQELTSRIDSSEIPEVLKKLEEEFKKTSNKAIDICLATNMVATGVDISRLGLMFIHGQPKTTSEYIQASSRVGRRLPNGPGLIFALYSPTKPRDKSLYEQFQGYHSRIYSNVEPTSVTPFSINARERALHAIFIGLIRHFSAGPLRDSPRTDVTEFDVLCERVKRIILDRCEIVDSEEKQNTSDLLDRIIKFWKTKGVQHYGDGGNFAILNNTSYYPLMYANSAEVREEIVIENKSFSTPTSMRGVDTESKITVYSNNNVNG